MKCVCPMGGDRVCPDDCPLAVWASLTPTDRKAQRKPIAEKLYKQNFTREQIATQLGVNVRTIYRDLVNFDTVSNSKPAKTASNPKGAGRPRGKRSAPKPHPQRAAIIARADRGLSDKNIAAETGIPKDTVRREVEREQIERAAKAEPIIDRTDLSMTAQEKLDVAIRQHKRQLDLDFEKRVLAECEERLNSVSLPYYAKHLEQIERMIVARKGVMNKITYNKIRWCLHSDHVQDPSLKKRYDEAFTIFNDLEKLLLSEKESPTQFRKIPKNYDELMAARAKIKAENKAKYANRSKGIAR